MSSFKIRLVLGIRNLTRHKVRSGLSILMISGAVFGIIIFKGFTGYTLGLLKKIAVENQYGHIQIAKKSYWTGENTDDRLSSMFDINEINGFSKNLKENISISSRVSFTALISVGEITFGTSAIGVDLKNDKTFLNSVKILQGSCFDTNSKNEIIVGALLAEQLGIKIGNDVTLLTNAANGSLSAIDLKVTGVFTAGIDEIDSQVVYMPLNTAQKILNTDMVDVAVLKFYNSDLALDKMQVIQKNIKMINNDLEARSWKDLAKFYAQVKKYLGTQNFTIEMILTSIIFLGILNSVAISIAERVGEVGTLRALGENRLGIFKQFILESLLVSFIGNMWGILMSLVFIYFIDSLNISTEMPGATIPILLKINFDIVSVFYAFGISVFISLVATLLPSYQVSKIEIVEGLRRNI